MNTRLLSIANAVAIALAGINTSTALAGNGQPLNTTVGYVNYPEVRGAYAPAVALDRLKAEAEGRLQLAVYLANEQLEKARKEGKSKSELEKIQEDLQHEVKGRQDSASEMIQSQTFAVNQILAAAVMQAAKEKGVELVVDQTGVLLGGKRVTDSGIDITDLVKKKLATAQSPIEVAKPADRSEADTAKPGSKTGSEATQK